MGPHSPPHAAGNTGFRSEEFVSPSSFLSVPRDAQQTRPGTVGSSGPWKAEQFEGLTDNLLEQGVQLCGLDRLLQHRCVRKRRNNSARPVAGDEGKRDFSIVENIGDGIGFFAPKIHVENTRLQVSGLRRDYGVAEPAVGTIDLVPEGGKHVREHHLHERLVFAEKNSLLAGTGSGRAPVPYALA